MQQQQKTTTNKQKEKHQHKQNPQNKIKIFVANFGHLYFRSGRFSETMKDRGISSTY
jgi:hypothetical protein